MVESRVRTVPVGTIMLWSGLLADIPVGWALCDGGGGRPDLRDKFTKGAPAGQNPGGTGGSLTHTHDSHGGLVKHGTTATADTFTSPTTHSSVNHEPPYYKVAYIIKV